MDDKEIQKILAEVQHRAFVRDLKKTYPNKTDEEIEHLIKAIDEFNRKSARNYDTELNKGED